MMQGPLALIAEVTHSCPLHCVYCSNPIELTTRRSELSTDTWVRIFQQAADLGVLQVHLTGGEPLARPDIVELAAAARRCELYVNLITSGIGMSDERLDALANAGVDHIQLSLQDSRAPEADWIAGARAHSLKLALATRIHAQGIALTLNIVVHRQNLDRIEEMIALAENSGTDRLEIAHVQHYGWALANRRHLLPTREQVDRSLAVVDAARTRLQGRMTIDCVTPDYYARFPKACMGGWGQKLILVDPAGLALPCHAAGVIPELRFDNVSEHPLKWIWEESQAFQKFRGEEWMPEPCRSCERRVVDFGGCRCQALLLTGDAAKTDPVCELSSDHGIVLAALDATANMAGNELLALAKERAGAGDAMSSADGNDLPVAQGGSAPSPLVQPDWLYRQNALVTK
jgi:pyrroloquinoline quinone biosynthesis protein E